jgi:hypothetical protein
MTSASGALKVVSGEGEENVIEVWDGSRVSMNHLDHLDQGALVRFGRA